MQTAYLSSYAQRVQSVLMFPTTEDSISVNARAVLGEGETLTQADWETDDAGVAGLVSATLDDAEAVCVIRTAVGGYANIRCQLTTSSGRKLPQLFRVEADSVPFVDGVSYGGQTLSVINP